MSNHAARSYLLCVRKKMQALGYDDESPKNIIALRQKHGLVSPSDGSIQSMFGQRMSLVKTDISRAVLKIMNREAEQQKLALMPETQIIQFNSVVIGIGTMVAFLEARQGAATDVRSDIAVAAGYTRDVIDAAISNRLFPRMVAENIERALQTYGVKTYGIREVANGDAAWKIPARDGGRAFILHRLSEENC